MLYRTLFLTAICFFFVGFSQESAAKDRLPIAGAESHIIRHGIPTDITEPDKKSLKALLKSVFSAQESSTETPAMKQGFLAHGKTLEEQWAETATKSFFSYTGKPRSTARSTYIEELRIIIEENADKNPIGKAYGKLPDGSIRGYNLEGNELLSLYCADFLQKYLPSHYTKLFDTYAQDEYADSGVSCTGNSLKPKQKRTFKSQMTEDSSDETDY